MIKEYIASDNPYSESREKMELTKHKLMLDFHVFFCFAYAFLMTYHLWKFCSACEFSSVRLRTSDHAHFFDTNLTMFHKIATDTQVSDIHLLKGPSTKRQYCCLPWRPGCNFFFWRPKVCLSYPAEISVKPPMAEQSGQPLALPLVSWINNRNCLPDPLARRKKNQLSSVKICSCIHDKKLAQNDWWLYHVFIN